MLETVQMFFVFLIVAFVVISLFLFVRDAILWYFRINEARDNERKIIELLQRIANKP